MRVVRASLAAAALVIGVAACGDEDDGPDTDAAAEDVAEDDEPRVQFVEPADGDTVTAPVPVEMEATGIEIAEAGTTDEGTGHFHVMVDVGCVEEGEPIPEDDEHIHYGDASNTDELELEPGSYDLCLQIGDGNHVAEDLTDEISITVEGGDVTAGDE